MNHCPLKLLTAAVSMSGLTSFAAESPMPFAEAVFTEVINDVQVVRGTDAKAVKAEKNAHFRAPDLVRTGRKSRAQLTAADGTVARVGSNAVFSFDKDSRTMNLQSGSVLFHSPTGKGGGTIVTNSATASVIGTTIVVSATADGGFKLLVLEGVAKVVFPNGAVSTLNAGQMTFVLPGSTVENKDAGSTAGSDDNKGAGSNSGGLPGPVLNFDLGAVSSDSGLVGGFKSELPSAGKIRLARRDQLDRIGDGELRPTGLPILGAESGDTIILGDPTVIQQAMQLIAATEQQRLLDAAGRPLTLDGITLIPTAFVFRNAVAIPDSLRPAGPTPLGAYLQGLAAGDLTVGTAVLDLGFMQGRAHVDVLGFKSLRLGNVDFQTAPGTTSLRIGGRQVLIQPGSGVNALLDGSVDTSAPTRFVVESFTSANYDGVSFGNATGDVQLLSLTGDLKMTGGAVDANTVLGHADFGAANGAVELTSVSITAGPAANIIARTGVLLDGTSVSASHVEVNAIAGGVVIRNGSLIDGYGARSVTIAGNGIAIADSSFNTPGPVRLDARTANLAVSASFVRAEAVTVTAANVSLVGDAGLVAGNGAFGGELNAGTGALSLTAQGELSLDSAFRVVGNVADITAARLSMANSTVESAGGGLTAHVTDVLLQAGSLIGSGFVALNASGKVEILDGSRLYSSGGSVGVDGATVRISGATLQSDALLTRVHATGDIRIDGASSSFGGPAIEITSDSGRVQVDVATLQAGPVNRVAAAPALVAGGALVLGGTTPPPSGITVVGNGVQLGDGTVIAGGVGVVTIDARAYDLAITRPAVTGNGVALNGAVLTLTGVGGSEDASGNITFGGKINAGSGTLKVSGGTLTVGGYTHLLGLTANVNLTGAATLNLARIESVNTPFDFTADTLGMTEAELLGTRGLNLHITGAVTIDRANLKSGAAQVAVDAGSFAFNDGIVEASTDAIVRTSGDQAWTGGTLTATRAQFQGLNSAVPNRIALTGISLAVGELSVAAHTVELSNVTVSDANAAMTFRSDLGRLNSPNYAPGGTQLPAMVAAYAVQTGYVNIESLLVPTDGYSDVVAFGLVWSPEDNLGDASLPVHILKLGDADYRGESAKLDYARATDFNEVSLTRFNPALPLSNVFRQWAQAVLTNADFGLGDTEVIPTIDGGGTHTFLEVQGLLARNITLNGPVTLDLTSLNPQAGEINARMDIVATSTLSWNGALTVHADSASHRRLEFRARNIQMQNGASFTSDLPYDYMAPGAASSVMFAAINGFSSVGTITTPNVIANPAGAIEIGVAKGDVVLDKTKVIAGFQPVDTTQTIPMAGMIQPGVVNITTFAPAAQIRVLGGELMGHAASATEVGVEIDGATVDVANVSIRAESRSMVTAGTEPLYTSQPGGGTYGGQTDVTAGQYKSSGAIRVYGTALVKIQGGVISAADVTIGASPKAPAGTTLDAIEMDGTNFVMAASQALFDQQFAWTGSTGIAMEAKTLNLKNIVFPDNVQVRLRSQDGVLNIVGASGTMFGAVNFTNVGVRTVGDTANPGGGVTSLTTQAGINSKVWIEGGKVYFDKALNTGVTGTGSASTAPIHIQSIGAANQQGAHGSNF